MKKLIPFVLALALTAALLWILGGRGTPALGTVQAGGSDAPPAVSENSLLVATNTPYWPMEYISDTQIVGHDIDLMKAIAAETGATVVYTDVAWDGILDGLVAGEYDEIVPALTVLPERRGIADFTLPYVSIYEEDDLAIAVQEGDVVLRQQINDALQQLRDDGTLQAIVASVAAEKPEWQARLPDWAYCRARINDDPTEFTSVQAAVDAASAGDIVKVAGYCSGVEPRAGVTQTVYISKSITLRGGYPTTNWTTPDPTASPTTLDAKGQERVIYITGDISLTIEGLHITGGNAVGLGGTPRPSDAGGGVYVKDATVTISNCSVINNTSGELAFAGGIYLGGSGATLIRNTLSDNDASWGGGLYATNSDALLEGNTVISNSAWYGGGVDVRNSAATLSRNIFLRNTASDDGGGLYLVGSECILTNNVIASNEAGGAGGGGRVLAETFERRLAGLGVKLPVVLAAKLFGGRLAELNGGPGKNKDACLASCREADITPSVLRDQG